MVEQETTVGPPEGLHARPAAEFVRLAKGFSSEIVVRKEEANAKSSLKPMSLGAQHGDKMLIRAESYDARQAVDVLVERLGVEE